MSLLTPTLLCFVICERSNSSVRSLNINIRLIKSFITLHKTLAPLNPLCLNDSGFSAPRNENQNKTELLFICSALPYIFYIDSRLGFRSLSIKIFIAELFLGSFTHLS